MDIKFYVKNIAKIRKLSSPHIKIARKPSSYHKILIKNFAKIRKLSLQNTEFLNTYIFPVLSAKDRELDKAEMLFLKTFIEQLLSMTDMQNWDVMLASQIADRLLLDAKKKDDSTYLVEQMDYQAVIYFSLRNMTDRMHKYSELGIQSYEKSFKATHYLYSLLEPSSFLKLDEPSRELVLINSRYILSLFDDKSIQNRRTIDDKEIFNIITRTIDIAEDDFYKKLAPNYNWQNHILRTLEYAGLLLASGGGLYFSQDVCAYFEQCTAQLNFLIHKNKKKDRTISLSEANLHHARAQYYSGILSFKNYAEQLKEIFNEEKDNFSIKNCFYRQILIIVEYIVAMEHNSFIDVPMEYLTKIYALLLCYVEKLKNKGPMLFLLEYTSYVLNFFREVDGGISFEAMSLSLMSIMQPLIYVHLKMVGLISECIGKYLLNSHPELFIGVDGHTSLEDVKTHSEDILNFIYHGACCHDVGKLSFLDTIFIYERQLFNAEAELIHEHTCAGGYMLSRNASSKKYANIAYGHHKWYNDKDGYPESWKNSELPEKIVIDIVSFADSLDAATDGVGRAYTNSLSLKEFIAEVKLLKGTRYAPQIVDLFSRYDFLTDIYNITTKKRDELYASPFYDVRDLVSNCNGEFPSQ